MRDRTYDAILIGAGHNSLVCACLLSRHGWSTLVLEQADRPGGAVQSAEATAPGYVHDIFATNLNLFLGSAAAGELGADLERHGFATAVSRYPFANAFPDGRALRVHQGIEATFAEIDRHDAQDGEGWRALNALYERLSPALFAIYGSRLDTRSLVSLAAEHLPRLGAPGARELGRLVLSSSREISEAYLHTPEARALFACWGMHLDFGPDVSGGALFPFLEAFTDMRTGIAIARGGASTLIEALVHLIQDNGGEVRTEAEVARVMVSDGRATGVELESGERILATRAVIAGVAPRAIFGRLLGESDPRIRTAARRYRYGPGTMMLHLALSGPPKWEAEGLEDFAYVHIGPYTDDLAATYAQACAGLLPADPMLVVGQTSRVDDSRAPHGEVVWVQVRALPADIRGDTLNEIEERSWDRAALPYASRVLAKLERYAPGFKDLVIDSKILTPMDLERNNPNLVGGDSISGSMHLSQNFLFRPFPETRDYATGINGLLMLGASTWPGAGVNAISGYNVARKLLTPPVRKVEDLKLALDVLNAAARALGRRSRSH